MSRLVDDMARAAARYDGMFAGFRLTGESDLACAVDNAAHALRVAIVALNTAEAALKDARS